MSKLRAVIIIPNYNGVEVTYEGKPIIKQCLDSLKKTAFRDYVVLVSDDCSTANSVDYIRKNWPDVKIIKRRENGGYAVNANTGLKHALKNIEFNYAVMLNSDIIITDPEWLGKLIKLAESDDNIGMVGCNLIYPNGRTQGNVIRFTDRFSLHILGKNEKNYREYSKVKDAHIISGAVQVIKRRTLDQVGLMDANFINGYDDEDYCLRLKKAGMRLVYDGKVKVVHLQNITIRNTKSKISNPSKKVYNNSRNAFYFLRKHRSECGYIRLPIWYCIYFLRPFVEIGTQNGEIDFSKIRLSNGFWFKLRFVTKALIDSFRLQIRS